MPQQVTGYAIGRALRTSSPGVSVVSETKILRTHYEVSIEEGDAVKDIITILSKVPVQAKFVEAWGGPDEDGSHPEVLKFEVETSEEVSS